jgi:NADPH:quinone reductase-like Zn-dependent oxidoreductase
LLAAEIFIAAAAIPIAGKTALESIRALDLKAGESVFIAGASGAIGTLVIQMAAARGVRVAGSASRRNHEYMLSLGAEKAVDYNDPNWKEQVKEWMPGGVCAALAIQPGTADDCIDVVKDGGVVVTVSGDTAPSRRNIHGFQFEHHEETQGALSELACDIAAGRIRLVLEKIYPFQQTLDALRKTETRHARGKLAVDLDGEL